MADENDPGGPEDTLPESKPKPIPDEPGSTAERAPEPIEEIAPAMEVGPGALAEQTLFEPIVEQIEPEISRAEPEAEALIASIEQCDDAAPDLAPVADDEPAPLTEAPMEEAWRVAAEDAPEPEPAAAEEASDQWRIEETTETLAEHEHHEVAPEAAIAGPRQDLPTNYFRAAGDPDELPPEPDTSLRGKAAALMAAARVRLAQYTHRAHPHVSKAWHTTRTIAGEVATRASQIQRPRNVR